MPIGSSLFPSDVGADLAGLAPGATYHFRLVATNGIGTTFGPDQTFTTTAPNGGGSDQDCDQSVPRSGEVQQGSETSAVERQ